jgi:anthranilate phosphoribosyltransferase
MLNGDVPDLEMGGILIALRIKGEGEAEMRGFYEAMQAQTLRLTPPVAKPMPIVIPSYNGARKQANLTPLLAILLHKLGFPVVVHGVSEDPTRVLTETIFGMLGIEPTRHAGQAQAKLDGHQPVYIPVGALPAAGKAAGYALAHGRAQQRAHAGETGHAVWRRCRPASFQRFAPGIRGARREVL